MLPRKAENWQRVIRSSVPCVGQEQSVGRLMSDWARLHNRFGYFGLCRGWEL